MKLTVRQQEILDWIRARQRAEGAPPTRVEIAQAFGFRSPNAAEEHLRALARKGALELAPNRSRGIRVIEPTRREAETGTERTGSSAARRRGASLPLVGRVAAGSPVLADGNIDHWLGVDPALFRPRASYLLRVVGSSMIDAGIDDGDLLAVHATPDARNGQIVVARIDDEVTVKRLQQDGDRVRLLPENAAFAPIEVGPDRAFAIEGLAVGVIRQWQVQA